MNKDTSTFLFLFLFSQMIFAQQKSDSLQAILWSDTIKHTEFNEGVTGDPLQLILGKVPGAEVFKAGSDPNVPSSLVIRGINGLYSESQALFVIDGIVGGDLFLVPPQEIESIKILKNYSETSIYGIEGSNGVLLVTTKKGMKNRRLSMNFNTAVSLQQATTLHDLFTASDMREKALTHQEIQFFDGGANTNWQGELFRTTISQSYQLALGGTLKNTTYQVSFNHIDQPGNVRGTDRNATGGSINLSQTAFKKKLQINGQMSYYQSKIHVIDYPAGRYGENLFYQTFNQNPTDPVYTANGDYYQGNRVFEYYNPIALNNLITNEGKIKQLSAVLNTTWEIWKGFGIIVTYSHTGHKTNTLYNRLPGANPNADALSTEGTDNHSRTNFLAGITFNRILGKNHFFDLFTGYMYRYSSQDYARYSYQESSTAGDSSVEKIWYRDYGLRTYLNYHYKQKYYIRFVINQEHYQSHVTPEQNGTTLGWGQWVFYPGISASWEISQEGFMSKIKTVSTLILRGGYGIAGARPKPEYLSEYNPGYNDKELSTETITEFTAALVAGLFRNRIMAEIEFYHRNNVNALFRQPVHVPPNLYPYSYLNGMKVINYGIELKIMTRVIDNRMMVWNSGLCFSGNKNKVISIEGETPINSGYIDYYETYSDSPYILTTTSGHSILAYNMPVFHGYSNGVPVYEGKDGVFTTYVDGAKREISDNVYPDYILSWTNSFTLFKTVDLSLMFQYVAGHRIFNGTRMYLSVPGNYLVLNTLPEAENNYEDGVKRIPFSNIYLENASYLRLENLSVGYTFIPQNRKWKGRLRVYLAANNLFTITGYSGLDPSYNYYAHGLDYFNTYPKYRSFTLGINLEI